MSNLIKCPVCKEEFTSKGLIFHIRKTAVFEVYEACLSLREKGTCLEAIAMSPHQRYIEENSKQITRFSI